MMHLPEPWFYHLWTGNIICLFSLMELWESRIMLVLSDGRKIYCFVLIMLFLYVYRIQHSCTFSVMIFFFFFFLLVLGSRDVNQRATNLTIINPLYRFVWYLVRCGIRVPASTKWISAVCVFSLVWGRGRIQGYAGRVSEAVGIAILPGRMPSPPPVYHLPSVLSHVQSWLRNMHGLHWVLHGPSRVEKCNPW